MRTLKEAVTECKGVTAASTLLGVTPPRLSNWIERGVPVEHCAQVHEVLGVARWVLRPDDWHRIWPELIGTDGAPVVPEATQAAAES